MMQSLFVAGNAGAVLPGSKPSISLKVRPTDSGLSALRVSRALPSTVGRKNNLTVPSMLMKSSAGPGDDRTGDKLV